jgi:hypothetical protein
LDQSTKKEIWGVLEIKTYTPVMISGGLMTLAMRGIWAAGKSTLNWVL